MIMIMIKCTINIENI